MSDDRIELGPCCYCGGMDNVINVMMLPWLHPTPGCGWGCFVCNLPANGAIAVLCDACLAQTPKFVCAEAMKNPARIPFEDLAPDTFEHDVTAHLLDELEQVALLSASLVIEPERGEDPHECED